MDYTTLFISMGGWLVTLIGYILVDRREKQKQLDAFKKDIINTLGEHRKEYLQGINDVHSEITNLQSTYKQTQAVIELKIDNLEKKQDKHNSVIERIYKAEQEVEVLKNRESVSEHRISDLEKR